jgi:hypothetical protein
MLRREMANQLSKELILISLVLVQRYLVVAPAPYGAWVGQCPPLKWPAPRGWGHEEGHGHND